LLTLCLSEKREVYKKGKSTIPISEHPALSLEDPAVRRSFEAMYMATSKLYYNGQPPFDEVMNRIKDFLTKL